MLKPRGAAIGLLLLAQAELSVGLVSVWNGFTDQTRRALAVVQGEVGSTWRLSAARYGRLPVNREDKQLFTLRAGTGYRLEGVCDGNCSALSFTLLDENGSEVDRASRRRARPSVEVTPVRSATFLLKVSMADCRTAGCAYGVGLFADGR